VVKRTLKGENDELNRIVRHLQERSYSSLPARISLVKAELTIELKSGQHHTVYHAAKGTQLYDILRTQSPSVDATQEYLPLFRHVGRALFNAHESLRPTDEEIAQAVRGRQINIHRFYGDIDDTETNSGCVLVPYDAEKHYFFSRCFGDVQPTNVFLHDNEVELIDYLSLTRDLPDANGFSSIANDVAYFIACTRVCFRSFYPHRDGRYLNRVMGRFLAGYSEQVPPKYRTDMFDLIRCGFNWFGDVTIMPSLSYLPSTAEEKAQRKTYDVLRRRYKQEEIEIILTVAAQLLFLDDANAVA
jgi:hypothetical protein